MATGLTYHPDCLKHIPYPGNPEVPERVSGTFERFRETGLLDELTLLTPEPASDGDITRVHTQEHLDDIRCVSETGYDESHILNPDVYVCPDTCNAAFLSVGGAMLALESVWKGEVDNSFALIRPPGHHAKSLVASGFCYFHNSAIAVRYLQQTKGLDRVAYFDWDAHAGNGTMSIFYRDPSVLTISVHQDPASFYPGEGFVEQTGEDEGEGYCMNIPVPAGTGDADYAHIIDDFVVPNLVDFHPNLIVVSAGQDSHASDPISGLQLSDDGFVAMTMKLLEAARGICMGRIAFVLEGGYNLQTLPGTHEAIVSALMGKREMPKLEGEVRQSTKDVLDRLRKELGQN